MNTRRRTFLKAGLAAAAGLGGSAFGIRSGRSFDGGMVGVDAALGHRFRDGGFPEPTSTVDSGVLVVGGGIAGLSAARELDRLGLRDWKLLELESEAFLSLCGEKRTQDRIMFMLEKGKPLRN